MIRTIIIPIFIFIPIYGFIKSGDWKLFYEEMRHNRRFEVMKKTIKDFISTFKDDSNM